MPTNCLRVAVQTKFILHRQLWQLFHHKVHKNHQGYLWLHIKLFGPFVFFVVDLGDRKADSGCYWSTPISP
jgi:hypothetical protein